MTGPATGVPDRGESTPAGTTRPGDAVSAVVILLALGFALRLIIAYVLVPGAGFGVDIQAFRFWAGELASHGPYGFYERGFFADYTPGYLYVLWLVGLVGQAIGGIGDLIKLPPILADVGIGWLVWSMARELGAPRAGALVGAAFFVLNPVSWFDSAVWGQVDSFGTLFLLLAVRELWRGHSAGATVLTTVAAIIKPQFGILIPIAAVVLLRRHLWVRRDGDGPLRLTLVVAAGLATATLICLPFGMTILELARRIVQTATEYHYLTVNAFNPWALVSQDGTGLAAGGTWIDDVGYLIGPLPAVVIGSALLVAAIVAGCAVVARRDDRRTLLLTLTILAVAFFVLPTRVHERYLYPFFAFAAILAAVSLRWRAAYLIACVANFANLYAVLTNPFYKNPGVLDWLGLGPQIRSFGGVALAALAHLGVLAWGAWQLRAKALDAEDVTWARAAAHERAAALALPGPGSRPLAVATRANLPAVAGSGWVRRLIRHPTHDRTASLAREPGGRLDRLDLWLVVVLVTLALVSRTFRLGEPVQMHFDEVYHARTATEFLQDWRYGIPHDIYEYTHPHLAKYAIAAGIVAFAGDSVTAQSSVGAPVRSAVVEPRYADSTLPGGLGGERVYLATGAEIRAYDLGSRARVATIPAPGAAAVAVDQVGHRLLVGTDGGDVLDVDTRSTLDMARSGATTLAHVGGPIVRVLVTEDGSAIVAALADGTVVTLDAATGAERGRVAVPGVSDLAPGGTAEVLSATPAAVPDVAAAARTLAELLGGDLSGYEATLRSSAAESIVAGSLTSEQRTAVNAAIADGRLDGFALVAKPQVAVAATAGVVFIDPSTGGAAETIALDTPATGLAYFEEGDPPRLYVAQGLKLAVIRIPRAGDTAAGGPGLDRTYAMPGRIERVVVDDGTRIVHLLGRTPDGSATTIYAVETNGYAVFSDSRLPFEPAAWALDAAPLYPSSDREQILAFAEDGAAASVSVGGYAFAWRLPGVIAGALMAGLIFLLARILFRRRSIAVLAGLFTLVDGMFFVQSRIAMNDAYVGLFVVGALTIFAALWTGAWRARAAFWLGLPAIGLLLGLGLASKWVALYAIGGIVLLILARSALGRVIAILGLAGLTAVLGYLAIAVPPEAATSGGNVFFLGLMIAITLGTVVASVLHPVAWTLEEMWFAVVAPGALGVAGALAAFALGLPSIVLLGSFGLLGLAAVAAVAFRIAAWWGLGPLAPPLAPDDPGALLESSVPAPPGWLRLGSGWGVPAVWMAVSLLVIPLVVYVVSYLPWVALGNRLTDTWPSGNTGQTLLDLTRSMYEYHNNLRATHAASSPWWAWPLDLKPVWFYQESFAGATSAAIYSGGNLVIWWTSIPAMAFVGWQAFRRRSLALAFVLVAFLVMWLPWVRIDRATFEYHYYTSLPLVILALAYFVAELWRGPSRRTWLLARIAAALTVLGAPLMWLLKGPLCAYVRVEAVNPGSQACVNTAGQVVVTERVAAIVIVLGVAIAALLWQLFRLERTDDIEPPAMNRRLLGLASTAVAAALALAATGGLSAQTAILTLSSVPSELIALLVAVPFVLVAWVVLGARDPRRFVYGFCAAAVAFFVLWYPNWAALPLPSTVFNAYQGFLPTWLYPFQFPVNTDEPFPVKLFDVWPAVLLGALLVTCAVVAYSVWTWRLALAERAAERAAGGSGAESLAAGGGR